MSRYVIVRLLDGLVVNAVEWDGGPQWSPPSGHTAFQDNIAGVGDIWDGVTFTRPPLLPSPEQLEDEAAVPLVQQAIAFRNRSDYLTEPSFAALPALSPTATAAQTRDYIIANVIPRLNALSAGANDAVPRINVNTKASQNIIKVLLYIGRRLMGLAG